MDSLRTGTVLVVLKAVVLRLAFLAIFSLGLGLLLVSIMGDDLTELDGLSLSRPKWMASSKRNSLPVSGCVKIPDVSSTRPRRSASWKVMASLAEDAEDTWMYRLTVCVTVAVVTVMFSKDLSIATPTGVMSWSCNAFSIGTVLSVAELITRPLLGSMRCSATASSRESSRFLSAL